MRPETGTIMVGYDGSSPADEALAWAAETTLLQGHTVRAVIVDEDGDALRTGSDQQTVTDELLAGANTVLTASGVAGAVERHSGQVVPVLLREARFASMLVVGSQGHGWASETVRRSVSQQLARRAPCPVVVVRAAAQPKASRIVVGVDGSRQSHAALDFACRRAAATGESVVAVHAWRPGRTNVDARGQLSRRIAERSQAADEALRRYVTDLRTGYPNVTLESQTFAVAPAEALERTSAHASLVVTGSRGRSAVNGVLRGSVSHHLLHSARCPVAVVRG